MKEYLWTFIWLFLRHTRYDFNVRLNKSGYCLISKSCLNGLIVWVSQWHWRWQRMRRSRGSKVVMWKVGKWGRWCCWWWLKAVHVCLLMFSGHCTQVLNIVYSIVTVAFGCLRALVWFTPSFRVFNYTFPQFIFVYRSVFSHL